MGGPLGGLLGGPSGVPPRILQEHMPVGLIEESLKWSLGCPLGGQPRCPFEGPLKGPP